jgi:MFS family permease
MANTRTALWVIVVAQFFGTSLWFTPNAVMPGLAQSWGVTAEDLGRLTGSVQLGFIIGTLAFALSGLADRWRASRIFLVSAVTGAVANGLFALSPSLEIGLALRFATGLCLAGIYPVGMKLVAGWAPEKKGLALGWLVGMLTLGTAFPHLMRAISPGWGWQPVVLASSVLAIAAGLMISRLGDGPGLPATGRFDWGGVIRSFREPGFRAAALGYFGHMWELYAVWALAPLLVAASLGPSGSDQTMVSITAFAFIAAGTLGCVLGGMLSRRIGSTRVAFGALWLSGLMCLLWPWFGAVPTWLAVILLLVWGMAVIADSPQFSALAAEAAPGHAVGSSLAIMNSIGFLLTVFAIELTAGFWQSLGTSVTWLLVIGPVLGLLALLPLCRDR